MSGCCTSGNDHKSSIKKYIYDLKTSTFCGVKGFLTFNLALSSYLLCFNHVPNTLNQWVSEPNCKSRSKFAMKRNLIPFIEMVTIVPLFYFCMMLNMGLLQCTFMCATLMVVTCFMVRVFHLREQLFKVVHKLLGWEDSLSDELIEKELNNNDSLCYPVLNEDGHVLFRYSATYFKPGNEDKQPTLLLPVRIVLQCMQSCILLALSAVELLETIPSFFVDLLCDRSFTATRSNLQKSGHLAYASIRNLITPMSKFDQTFIEWIGTPNEQACCSA